MCTILRQECYFADGYRTLQNTRYTMRVVGDAVKKIITDRTIGYRIIDRATTALYGAIAEPLRHEDITPSGQELAQTAEDGEVPMGHRGAWVDGAQLVRLLEFDLDRRDAEAVAPDVVARAQGVLDVQRVEPEASCGWLALRGPLGWSRASAMLLPPPMGRHS
jgi:hypothetical protein